MTTGVTITDDSVVAAGLWGTELSGTGAELWGAEDSGEGTGVPEPASGVELVAGVGAGDSGVGTGVSEPAAGVEAVSGQIYFKLDGFPKISSISTYRRGLGDGDQSGATVRVNLGRSLVDRRSERRGRADGGKRSRARGHNTVHAHGRRRRGRSNARGSGGAALRGRSWRRGNRRGSVDRRRRRSRRGGVCRGRRRGRWHGRGGVLRSVGGRRRGRAAASNRAAGGHGLGARGDRQRGAGLNRNGRRTRGHGDIFGGPNRLAVAADFLGGSEAGTGNDGTANGGRVDETHFLCKRVTAAGLWVDRKNGPLKNQRSKGLQSEGLPRGWEADGEREGR